MAKQRAEPLAALQGMLAQGMANMEASLKASSFSYTWPLTTTQNCQPGNEAKSGGRGAASRPGANSGADSLVNEQGNVITYTGGAGLPSIDSNAVSVKINVLRGFVQSYFQHQPQELEDFLLYASGREEAAVTEF